MRPHAAWTSRLIPPIPNRAALRVVIVAAAATGEVAAAEVSVVVIAEAVAVAASVGSGETAMAVTAAGSERADRAAKAETARPYRRKPHLPLPPNPRRRVTIFRVPASARSGKHVHYA